MPGHEHVARDPVREQHPPSAGGEPRLASLTGPRAAPPERQALKGMSFEEGADFLAPVQLKTKPGAKANDAKAPQKAPEKPPEPGALEGTHAISEDDQKKVHHLLRPGSDEEGEIGCFVSEKYWVNMTNAVETVIRKMLPKSKTRQAAGAPKLDIAKVRDTGKVAQEQVKAAFGGLASAASLSSGDKSAAAAVDMSDPARLKSYDTLPESEVMTAAYDLLGMFMEHADIGGKVNLKHNYDASRKKDAAEFARTREIIWKRNEGGMKTLLKGWTGMANSQTHEVMIQTSLDPDDKLSKNEVERLGYWNRFGTLIHETIHVSEHPKFAEVSEYGPYAGSGILTEGFCEYFAQQVYDKCVQKAAGDVAFKQSVEGPAYDAKATTIPPRKSYPSELTAAKEVAAVIGEPNMRAVFFMGHNELLGRGSWSKKHAEEEAGGARYHTVIEHDTKDAIAKQHGVTVKALEKANAGVDWATLAPGTRVKVPGAAVS